MLPWRNVCALCINVLMPLTCLPFPDSAPPFGAAFSSNCVTTLFVYPLAHLFGPLTCTFLCGLALLFLLFVIGPGHSVERHCWWEWQGKCKKCSLPVKEMGGIFCAKFCEPQGGLTACRSAWHAECYKCLGVNQFPMMKQEDDEGNVWHEQSKFESRRHNHGVKGVHACIPFQCEECWI